MFKLKKKVILEKSELLEKIYSDLEILLKKYNLKINDIFIEEDPRKIIKIKMK
ncbi:hypothetical protein [uncultured Cetobacterium sp.]|uniref:hypothetical protein n=1 Tax=uncultured Cetobacterium sp. TaxID=527638 RepID=UPI00260A85FE|nr:hypothetical protein [uncultured Cetobacterium sp.]